MKREGVISAPALSILRHLGEIGIFSQGVEARNGRRVNRAKTSAST